MSTFFWQGCLHPLIVPAHLMVLLALGLLLGQQEKTSRRSGLVLFIVSILIALVLTRFLPHIQHSELTLLVLALALGVLVIVKLPLNSALLLSLSLITAMLMGLDSRVTALPGLDASKIYLQLLGTGISASLILSLLTILSFYLNKLLAGIAVRIVGAWVTAGSLMVLALLIHQLITAS